MSATSFLHKLCGCVLFLQLLISAGACQHGQCAVDDQTSLMQQTAKLQQNPEKVNKLQQDWSAFETDMDDKLSVEQDDPKGKKGTKLQIKKFVDVGYVVGDDGFAGNNKKGSTCFISKRTLFTNPTVTLNKECTSSPKMDAIEDNLYQAKECKACNARLEKLPIDLAMNPEDFYFTPKRNYTVKHPVIDQIKKDFLENDDTPKECQACDKIARAKVGCKGVKRANESQQDFRTRSFEEQQAYMQRIASKLTDKHGVNIYLDFGDQSAAKIVDDYGGRSVAFKSAVMQALMMTLLAVRADRSSRFIHWDGSAGVWCMGEQVGAIANKKHVDEVFESAPIAYLKKDGKKDPECGVEDGATYTNGKVPFLRRLCNMCGGTDCDSICKDPQTVQKKGANKL